MATKSSSKTAKTTKGLQYSDAVKAQGGVATNAQTGAKTYASSNKGASSARSQDAVVDATGKIIKQATPITDVDPSAVPTPTPTAAPIADTPLSPSLQPPTPTAGAITPQQALADAKATGLAAPQDSGEGRQAVQSFMPPATGSFYKPSADSQQVYDSTGAALSYDQFIAAGGKADFSNVQSGVPDTAVTQQIEADPAYQQLLADRKEYNDVVTQRKSLTEEYSAISKKLGIDELNTELMNMKNVIEGSEDDLRTEITKAGGFATESQVQALTMGRNKQLVKNYNNLLETKQMAMETLNTMIGLASQDRQFAQQSAMQKLQIDQQIIEYKDRMKTNAQNAMYKVAEQYGYSALVTGDPWQDALTEKTLGLARGGLQNLANSMTIQEQQFQQNFGLQQQQLEMAQRDQTLEHIKYNWDISPKNPKNAPSGQDGFTLGDGQTRYDANGNPIAGAGVNQGSQDPIQQAMARDKVSQFDKVISDLEKPSTVGVGTGGWRDFFVNPFSGKKSNFISDIEQIKGQIVGKTLGDMKAQGATFGALSDAELALVQQAASKISTWEQKDKNGKVTGYSVSPDAMRAELRKISSYAKLSYLKSGGSPDDIGIPKQPDGKYFLDAGGKMINVSPGSFNQAGNASASNQVKGIQIAAPKLQTIQLKPTSAKPASPLIQAYPQGSTGGQCGTWVRSIVERQGLSYPRVGDSLAEKTATAKKYGVPINQARVGSVVLTSENKTNGHVAYIIGSTPQGFVLGESNYGMNGKVSYGRVIPFNSPKILGIINPTKK